MTQISVDGDTSTNDTVIGLASGAAGNPKITDLGSPEAKQLENAVTALLQASPTSIAGHCLHQSLLGTLMLCLQPSPSELCETTYCMLCKTDCPSQNR